MLTIPVCIVGLTFTFLAYILVDSYLLWRVNEKLPAPERLPWWQRNRFRALKFDRKFYPRSSLRWVYWALVAAFFVFGWALMEKVT